MKYKPRGTYNGQLCAEDSQHGTLRYRAGGACVECSKAKSKARWDSGAKKRAKYDPTYRREHNLKKHYGLTIAEFDAKLEAQGFCCALCGTQTSADKHFHVDHDHETNIVRDLLCSKCNVGLGSFDDSPDKLHLAIAYLKRHGR